MCQSDYIVRTRFHSNVMGGEGTEALLSHFSLPQRKALRPGNFIGERWGPSALMRTGDSNSRQNPENPDMCSSEV